MLVFNKKFSKKKSKLYFGDRVAVLNDFIYQTGGNNWFSLFCLYSVALVFFFFLWSPFPIAGLVFC
jgi:hypothetical protein